MKVLGISGSPRRGGNTDLLLAEVLKGAANCGAEIKTIVLNDLDYIPCQNCDACFEAGRCKYEDDMQMVYCELSSADRIVLASPVHFMGVSARMKAMMERCQSLWARKYILKIPPLGNSRVRWGLFISVGGRTAQNLFQPSIAEVKAFFASLDISYAGELVFAGVDGKGEITRHPRALEQANAVGRKLAGG
jgi:multimeric flavodoxin WrbA